MFDRLPKRHECQQQKSELKCETMQKIKLMQSCSRVAFLLLAALLFLAPVISAKHNPLLSPKFKVKSMEREAIVCPTAPPAIGPYSHVRTK